MQVSERKYKSPSSSRVANRLTRYLCEEAAIGDFQIKSLELLEEIIADNAMGKLHRSRILRRYPRDKKAAEQILIDACKILLKHHKIRTSGIKYNAGTRTASANQGATC